MHFKQLNLIKFFSNFNIFQSKYQTGHFDRLVEIGIQQMLVDLVLRYKHTYV